jgi:hypothetical protein
MVPPAGSVHCCFQSATRAFSRVLSEPFAGRVHLRPALPRLVRTQSRILPTAVVFIRATAGVFCDVNDCIARQLRGTDTDRGHACHDCVG